MHGQGRPMSTDSIPIQEPLTALVVDDDPFMLELVSDMLRELGVTSVHTARNGVEATDKLDKAAWMPDVVLCDLNMPASDGFLFMEGLGARRFKGAVIVVSGMDSRTLHSATLMARFHRLLILGTLPKPIDRKALASALERLPRHVGSA